MAYLVNRNGGTTAPRSFGELLGFDPFRNFGGGVGLDIVRTEDGGYRVELPVAGFKPEEINVTLEDNVLTVNGKNERRQFTRSLLLPDDIDRENIAANVEHGMLTLGLNVHPKAQPRKIEVRYNAN